MFLWLLGRLESHIKNSACLALFKRHILALMKPTVSRTFYCHNPKCLKLITRLRTGLIRLRFYKFKHNF